ncbi:uncharacterized protein FOMMEDRAFT_162026 [Fomitiporia mediterranea MF3/22]|uniref:uncharacterized protein n=1 Tax=Fomitiporia mediterranea (strain MF3/22) TaxID=694068 RepID=UPI000440801F|nr:uncharacterized protein FOMMEDRAFT_162026 [Fomitiporia mediterranea MF3/22]EJC98267.1 hypothetical protein FOMMEDRAFT_162026 [Fomitiporia mediterranea MF3/22]
MPHHSTFPSDHRTASPISVTLFLPSERPMKIELIFDPSKVPPPPLASRVAPAAKSAAGGARMEGVQRTGGRPRRARGTRTKNQRPQKTVEDLDAEMEDYTAASNAPAAVPAPAA